MHVYEPSYVARRVEPAGLSLCAATEGHTMSVFGSTLTKNGAAIRPVGLEAPEQFGRVER